MMKDNFIKRLLVLALFPTGSVRRIYVGPMRGLVFRVSPISGISPWYSGTERGHQAVFQRLLRAGDIAIDTGANWGLHTLYLSRLVKARGQVISLEPFPPAFAELEWHIHNNKCENVTAISVAADADDGSMIFWPGESAATGKLDMVSTSTRDHREGLTVVTRTLDNLVRDIDPEKLRLIKIDVEGAEARVLAGADYLTAKYRPYFVIDLHSPEQDVKVAAWLTERHYVLQRLSGPPITRIDVGWPEPNGVWGSILAMPQGLS